MGSEEPSARTTSTCCWRDEAVLSTVLLNVVAFRTYVTNPLQQSGERHIVDSQHCEVTPRKVVGPLVNHEADMHSFTLSHAALQPISSCAAIAAPLSRKSKVVLTAAAPSIWIAGPPEHAPR